MSMYMGERVIERFMLPQSMCSCPLCGRVYGTRLTGERVEVSTEYCEKCYKKEYPEKAKTVTYKDCEEFVAETT